MKRLVIETLLNSLFPSVWKGRWIRWQQRKWLATLKRRTAEKILRDGVARLEIAVMRQIIKDAEEQAIRGAILSTSRHAARDGISSDAALVILQWLLMSRP